MAVEDVAVQVAMTRSGRADLAVSVWGDTGTPILALHPGVGDSRIWRWCAPAWAAAGHVVVAYDRRGFGETRYEEEPHDDIADLLAVTSATGASPAVVVANSRGGGLALDLALAHPDHVAGLVLIAPSPSGYSYEGWPTSRAEAEQDRLIEQADCVGDLDRVNRLEVRYWLDGVDQPEGRVQGPPRDLLLDMNDRALRAEPIGEAARPPPAWPRLEDIGVPVVVVVGEHDLPGIRRLCRELVAALPAAELVTIADSAHCPALDRPDELSRIVLELMASLPRAA